MKKVNLLAVGLVALIGLGNVSSARADLAAVCGTVLDLTNNYNTLYKPSNVHGGRGPSWISGCQSNAKAYRPNVSKFSIYSALGVKIGTFKRYDPGHRPYGARFYTGLPGGSPSTSTSLRSRARAQGGGSSNIYLQVKTANGGTCFKINTPTTRQGAITPQPGNGRNGPC